MQEGKEGEEDQSPENQEIEEIEYISDKSLDDEQEEDVERDALTVATTALDSTYNETVDQKSPDEVESRLDNYEKEYQALLE